MNELTAVYPGTFDPFTRGHEELLRRSARLFDRIIVAVARSEAKAPLFSLEERINIVRDITRAYTNVSVIGYDCLLMDFMRQQNARLVLRGLRAASDFEYEFQMAGMNRRIDPDIETVFLTPAEEFMFISGSMVREIARFGGDISQFVQPVVVERLKQRTTKN